MAKAPSPKSIIAATAEYFDLPVEDIVNTSNRLKHVTYARHLAIHVILKKTRLGHVEITRQFGLKNHASIGYAERTIQNLKRYRNVSADVAGIVANIKQ